jgi:IMP dehydrogenase
MKVADAMTPREDLVTVSLPGTREDALAYLQERSFSSVPVVKSTGDGESFRGLVTREGLIQQPDEDQLALLVEEVSTTTADATLTDLAALVRESGQRRVPVVDGRLEGIVTVTDVIRAMANGDVDGEVPAGGLAKRHVNCVHLETPLPVAERELSYADEAYGVVLDGDGDPCGMLTEVDIIDVARVVEGEESTGDAIANEDDEWMWEGIKAVGSRYMPTRNVELPAEPVREFMTEELVTVSGRRTAAEVAGLMLTHDIEQVPLMEAGDLEGIVTDMDLQEALV